MANEANSRHTTPFPRWGETAAQVPDAGVTEPPGGKKDTGWVAGVDVPNGAWWNWLHWAAAVFFRYIENSRSLLWTRNHVMAGAAAGEGAVTNGAGLSVNVAAARVWIAGQMQAVPAATNLALSAADPTDPRIDLVTARVTALVPNYFVTAGTPAATPVAPSLPAGHVPIAEVRVNAAAVAPTSTVDVREFGSLNVDRVGAFKRFDVGLGGLLGADVSVFRVLAENLQIYLGDSSDPQLRIDASIGKIFLKPEQVQFFTSIIRKFDIDSCGFQAADAAMAVSAQGNWLLDNTTAEIFGAVRVPYGATITAVRVYGTKNATTTGVENLQLFARDKNTGVRTDLIAGVVSSVGDPTGDFVLEATGIAHVVDLGATFSLQFGASPVGAGAMTIYGAEVEYTELNPFNGF